MTTKSAWGEPPKRLYRFINRIGQTMSKDAAICIVGCSDGKFVLPFLRKGFTVTALDFDKVSLYGGVKQAPIARETVACREYFPSMERNRYERIPVCEIQIDCLLTRARKERLEARLEIIEVDFYRNSLGRQFDAVFTSCSLQYKSNRDIPVGEVVEQLKRHVIPKGLFYMDYMMPLEDRHEWKSSHFFRAGEIRRYFDTGWNIISLREMTKPVFEAAHVDRPEDHFHRFGYILAQRMV